MGRNDPPGLTGNMPSLKKVYVLGLLNKFTLFGKRLMGQSVFPFPIIGGSHRPAYPLAMRPPSRPPPISGIMGGSADRRALRPKASDVLNPMALWGASLGQVQKGWITDPLPPDRDGREAYYRNKGIVIACRFGVGQIDKLRSCDDLKYSTTNMYCTSPTPIKLLTWGHIAQISLNIRQTEERWAFFKTDHEAE